MPAPTPELRANTQRRGVLLCLLLVAAYLALRLFHLGDVPPFTDETTYARWAQVIRLDPLHNLFVSMQDAKLPLHYWLLALTRPLATDPILAGRVLSVLLGALAIPCLIQLSRELWRLAPLGDSPLLFCFLTTALMITNPLVAMLQRLALAESLLLLEAIIVAWLALRLSRLIAEGAPPRACRVSALLLGLAWTLTLLTKQNSSYALWILPPAAICLRSHRQNWRTRLRSFLPLYAGATLLALTVFVPVLLSDSTHDLRTRLIYKPSFENHTTISNWTIARENLITLLSPRADQHAQWWPHDPAHPLQEGWLYLYLTPPLFFLTLLSFFYMVRRRAWAPLLFIALWVASQLVPLIALAGVFLSRYTLLGFFPLLLAPAWMLADLLPQLARSCARPLVTASGAMVIAALLAWPLAMTAWSAADYRAPTLAVCDLEQLQTKFSAGNSTVSAADWIDAESRRHPVTLITGSWIGLPNDYLYLRFAGNPNVQLYWFDAHGPLQNLPGQPDTYLLGRRRWIDRQPLPTALDPSRPVYLMVPAPFDPDAKRMVPVINADDLPPDARLVTSFRNLPDPRTGRSAYELRLLQLPPFCARDLGVTLAP